MKLGIIFCIMLQSGIITKITKFISDIPSTTKLLVLDILGLIISLCIIYYLSDKQKVIHSSRNHRIGYTPTEIWAKNPYIRFYQVLSVGFCGHGLLLLILKSIQMANICIVIYSAFFYIIISRDARDLLISWIVYFIYSTYRIFHTVQSIFLSFIYSNRSEEKYRKSEKIIGYHAGIEITQLPLIEKDLRKDQMKFTRTSSSSGKNLFFNVEGYQSWLSDSLGKNFKAKFSKNNGINWQIYKVVRRKAKAENIQKSMVNSFRSEFPGLECSGFIKEITLNEISSKNNPLRLYELKLPSPPYPQKLPLVQSLISLCQMNEENINLNFIFSKRTSFKKFEIENRIRNGRIDPTIKREIEPLWVGEVYSVKIFIESSRTLQELQYLMGNMGNMGKIFQNCINKNPRIKKVSLREILNIKLNMVIKGTILSRYSADFNFDLKFLRRAKRIPNENVSPKIDSKSEFSNTNLDLGHIFSNSKKTRTRAYIDIDALTMNCLIGGTPGMGKTVLLKSIVSQISEKAPKVGIIVINTSKKAEERHFPNFTVIKYGSSRNSSTNSSSNFAEISILNGKMNASSVLPFAHFHIPYGILPDNCDVTKVLKKISMNLTAVVGLLDFAYRYFYTPLLRYYNKFNNLPESLSLVFSMALRYLDLNPYAANEQQNLRQAISMRGRELIEDQKFLNIVQAQADLPVWLWRFLHDGGKYFLDLTDCDTIVKQFLVISLLQFIDVFTSDRNQLEHVKLKNLIVFDEAHDIFERTIDGDVKSDENVRKQAINNVIQPYLLEYRSRGIGTIISDQQPSILMKSIREQTSLKLLFRLGQECARIYSTNQELQEFIMNQQRYRCVVIDGVNGELYQVETHPP